MHAPPNSLNVRVRVRPRVTCPHCWTQFSTEDTLWVASHPELQDDPRLDGEGLRFLPTRFNVEGNAIDPHGAVCHEVACPNCHLRVPRPLFEMPAMTISIAGTPSCGKTYLLASMVWRMRDIMPKHFALAFSDADPVSNLQLHEYENQQFFNPDPDALVKLAKTQEHGELYDTVMFGDQLVEYPKPFVFAIRPNQGHPHAVNPQEASRLVCLYDNAGESFEPGRDQASAPVTRHLAKAHSLIFCFDPTQDPRFRQACRGRSGDPQVVVGMETRRQESVFHEMVDRVRRHAGLNQNEKHRRPLIVAVTKFDVWSSLLESDALPVPWVPIGDTGIYGFDAPRVNEVSSAVRDLLWRFTPEMVAAAEAFTDHVTFVPVSATGCGPEVDQETGQLLGIRPRDIAPIWAEVPLLQTLAQWGGGMVPYRVRRGASNASPKTG